MIEQHATLAPSSAPQWVRCPGSVAANLQAPGVEHERTRHGTASHWVGAECLKQNAKELSFCKRWVGETAPNGVVIDEEMAEGAQAWVDDVLLTVHPYKGRQVNVLEVEKRVHAPQIHEQNWGTVDSAFWVPHDSLLTVWDYKYGHREVDAKENYQLINYTAALIHELGIPEATEVRFRLIQPFCFHADTPIKTWTTTVKTLQPYFDQLREAAAKALTNPTLTAGIHCRDCAAVGRCRTARRAAYSILDYVNEPYAIETMDGRDLAVERQLLSAGAILLKARQEAIEDDLRARIQKGDTSSGLNLENKLGRLAWTIPPKQVALLGKQFGVDLDKADVVTPTQALQVVKNGPEELRAAIDRITKRPITGVKLVRQENSRAANAFKPRS